MIRAFDMILAAQRTVYDGLPTFANTRSMVHVADVADVVHNSRVTREQDDNPWQDETLDYRVSLCTVAQEVRKFRTMVREGKGFRPHACWRGYAGKDYSWCVMLRNLGMKSTTSEAR